MTVSFHACGAPEVLVGQWDSYACLDCNVWTESACGCEDSCAYRQRPETPSPVLQVVPPGPLP